MTLDAPSRRLVDGVRTAGFRAMHELTPRQARAQLAALRPAAAAPAEVAQIRDVPHVVPDGSTIELRIVTPPGRPAAVVVYLHGGGWVLGDLDSYELLARAFAVRSGCVVVMVGYRLAPEFPYPAPLDDVVSAISRVRDHRGDLVPELAEAAPIVLFGDSAGGNLAAAASHRLRSADSTGIALQLLAYPVTDCDFSRTSYLQDANQLILDRPTMRWFWNHYVPDRAQRSHESVSVLRAEDYRGLPPTVVVTAEHDVLRDEGEAYAARLAGAGVPVTARRFGGQMHGFLSYPHALPVGRAALRWLADQISLHLRARAYQADEPTTAGEGSR